MTVMGRINARTSVGRLRDKPCRQLNLEGSAASFNDGNDTVHVTRLTTTGLLLESRTPLSVGDVLQVLVPATPPVTAIVVWACETLFACEFQRPLTPATISRIELVSLPEHHTDPIHAETHGDEAPAETLGGRIRRLRLDRGMGMEHFASRIGVSKPTLWKWEKGTVFPRTRMLPAIAQALGVSEKELIHGSRHRSRQPRSMNFQSMTFPTRDAAVAAKKEELAQLFGVSASCIEVSIKA